MGGGKINNLKKVGKAFISQLLCISAIIGTASCSDDQVFNQTDNTPLQVSVNAQGTQFSRAIIHGEYLPDASSIGISLFTPEGADYDNQGYFNVKYTASGEGESQSWAAQGTTPSISANPANLLAYYPWSDDADLDLTAVPVENQTQTDYMYAGIVEGITNANPKVNIIMQHALTAIRVNLVLGDYTGDAGVSDIAVKSPGLASSATLNIASGELNGISGQGDEFALTTEFDLSTSGTANDVLFVPDASVTEGSTTVFATIGGKKYTASISFDEAYLQGYIYTYTLTLNNSGFQLTKVNVTPWRTGNDESAILEPEKDNAYIVKIVASFQESAGPTSYIEEDDVSYNNNIPTVQSRSADTFVFLHNIVGFVGTIDWGDGTTDTYTELTDNPSHYYSNDGQEYTITAKGKIEELSYRDASFSQCLKEIIYIGDCGITSMEGAFYQCHGLQSIPVGLFDKCTEVTNFNDAFYGCSNLQSIPEGLFDKCTEVESFASTFAYTGISNIPLRLFDNCTEVEYFGATFQDCINITSIPKGLFDNNTEVTNFYQTFAGTGITEIPEGLFDNCTEVTSFDGTFAAASITEIPKGLFDNNTMVISFNNVFSSTGIISIPEGLFDNCTGVTDFSYTFDCCYYLQSIPEGLFDYNTKVTSFTSTFAGCESLQSIPEGLFKNNTKVTNFSYVFNGCSNLTIIPSKTFATEEVVVNFSYSFAGSGITTIKNNAFNCPNLTNMSKWFESVSTLTTIEDNAFNCPNVTTFERTFYMCNSLQTIPEGLFDVCTKVTDFSDTFNNCTNLTSIPKGLFDNCTEITSFTNAFYGCKKLESIPSGLFDNCTKVTKFAQTFLGCSSLKRIPDGLFDNCTEVTGFTQTFYNCSSLQAIPEGIFDKNTKVKYFAGTFGSCTGLTGESPYTTINIDGVDTKVHLYERSNYPQYFTAPQSYSFCFSQCTGLTDYSSISYGWK